MAESVATSIGRCGVCSGLIHQMTPWTHVFVGVPPRAYPAHKDCAEPEETAVEAVVVSSPTTISPESFVAEEPAEPQPSMPVKEQKGTRRTKKENTE